ncbi:hypothetical protein ACO22_07607 [Paracoccidioides brasiliensis]|uniref:DOC domain-containing protein n=1 Tax=Paracoccidioides brasiliensis TaxID=121759 RepID=A0A1D2J457_PARBR|nr:hypothetical protein ACO22_07607 [Paracoccidioides brasiliensis]
MPRQGLRRAPGGRSVFPGEDGASASAPTADPTLRHSNFYDSAVSRNPRGEGNPLHTHTRTHDLAIAGDPDVGDMEDDIEERAGGLEDDIDVDIQDDGELGEEEGEEEIEYADEEDEEVEEEVEEEEEEEEGDYDEKDTSAPIPANLREISSLASWTVSTHKPGCGIAALRHPSPSQFWQSDGPQPHTLTLHFFKRVSIVRIRVYLDFELDESYTPTKMIFLAGMGGNDLVEFSTWHGEAPAGWVDIDLQGVGGRHEKAGRRKSHRRQNSTGGILSGMGDGPSTTRQRRDPSNNGIVGGDSDSTEYDTEDDDDDNDNDDDDDDDDDLDVDSSSDNVLKAMVIQVRISENHQNGKDTHVRGFQVFSRDDRRLAQPRRDSARKSIRGTSAAGTGAADARKVGTGSSVAAEQGGGAMEDVEVFGAAFDEDDWMGEMEIR